MKSNLHHRNNLKWKRVMKTGVYLFLMLLFTSLVSCYRDQDTDPLITDDMDEISDSSKVCILDKFAGIYTFSSDTHTSTHNIELSLHNTTFNSPIGLNGYGFWFPAAPFSGEFNNCQFTVKEYENVKRPGLSTPGGNPRYYYESMNGFGEYFPEEDSIKLFLNYKRTGDFPLNFSGNIYMKKID